MKAKETIEAKKAMLEMVENVINSTEYYYKYLTSDYSKCIDGKLEGEDPNYYKVRIEAYDKLYAMLEKMI